MDGSLNSHSSSVGDSEKMDEICKSRSVQELAEQYIDECISESPKRLPNFAGFFRWLRLSADARDHFMEAHEGEYRTLMMILEDEAWNSSLPPSIVSNYIKQYFSDDDKGGTQCEMTLTFAHDITKDGE